MSVARITTINLKSKEAAEENPAIMF